MSTFKKLIDFLSPTERKEFITLLCMIITMALLDAAGVASIIPLITVLSNPESIQTNKFLIYVYDTLNFQNNNQFYLLLCAIVFVMLVISLAFKARTTLMQLRFVHMREFSISKRLLEGYLRQSYSWFIKRNSSELTKNIFSELENVIGNGMLALINVIAQSAVSIAIVGLLFLIDSVLAITVIIVLGAAYSTIFIMMRKHLLQIGSDRVVLNQKRFLVVSEVFGAIKEIKVAGLEKKYIDRFIVPAQNYAHIKASAQLTSQLPRFLLEALAFGGLLLVILYLIKRGDGLDYLMPIIGLYAFAGYRLMPALQQIYGSLSQLRHVKPTLDALHLQLVEVSRSQSLNEVTKKLNFESVLDIDGISFKYSRGADSILKKVKFSIPVNTSVGLVGLSGSGKSTLADIILGLLQPNEGALTVDGCVIDVTNVSSWQSQIGYVPQQIYLSDDTIASNIAFGSDPNDIDYSEIERVSKIANLHDFITNELPLKYSTIVGERGVRLSGGQRQRIAIARAMYHKPKVLILDEATSALDGITEQAVIEAVNNINHTITIIMIAHRLSTVRNCDQIYLFNKGEIVARGTYDELNLSNKMFQTMNGTES